jgi:type IV pilus assembly protein PilY1
MPPSWPNPNATRNPTQVDDLYHAAVNSRGEMLNAQNSQELEAVLGGALLDIVARTNATATAATTSAAILQEDTLLYNVEFRSTDWSGNVDARAIDEDTGQVGGTVWSAEDELASRSPSSRKIFTWDGTEGISFTATDLTSAQVAALDVDASGTNDGLSADRVRWFRGEAVSGMRSRDSVLGRRLIGDIVNSRPTYVKTENRGYSLLPTVFSPDTYINFLSAITSRNPMLATGTNGGLMHVFDAVDGQELFAYMPSELLAGTEAGGSAPVVRLTDPAYEHRFYVDGTPAITDVLIGGSWRTVLIGTMGVGGRTVFAIDVTDPANITTNDILWEFTDPDLGYGVTEPQITPLVNGKFGVVFGNGYNSASNTSQLFVLDVATGALIKKIDTGEGSAASPNGLASVQTSDWPDANQISLYVYGGDLLGNMWRFDISDTNTGKWGADLLFVAEDSTGARQPITSAPRLAPAPNISGELMVLFGTGSYFRNQDDSLVNPQVQSLYGIRDTLGSRPIARSDLLQQSITWQSVNNALGEFRLLREVSNNTYDTKKPESGWYLDLIYDRNNAGERVIARPTFPSGAVRERVRFTTMTPNDDPCTAGRTGFIFDIDMFTGGRTDFSVFDIDSDELIGGGDLVDGRVISGIGGGQGEELTTIRSQDGTGDYFYTGEGERVGRGDGADGLASGLPVGRQSWQQLR